MSQQYELPAYQIEIPFLPDRALSPNSRVHWSVKGEAVRVLREAAFYLAIAAGIPKMKRAEIEITYRCPTSRRRDPDNWLIMAKPAIDGLVDAGVLLDDSSEYVCFKPVLFEKGKAATIIRIKELQR